SSVAVLLPVLRTPKCIFLSILLFNDTAATVIYTLSLHDALPISLGAGDFVRSAAFRHNKPTLVFSMEMTRLEIFIENTSVGLLRSEEHTSELQSRENLVCRLLLEKKNKTQ